MDTQGRGQPAHGSNAVWFVAPTPNGPWVVAESVPDDFQTIPPEYPVYNVKYVYIYDVTPEVIYMGYTPGYLGWYPYYGTVVYGTGYYYPGWYGAHYYPRPCTWGFYPHYVPVVGWGIGYTWSTGFYTMGVAWNYGWDCWGWYGPAGYYGWHARDFYYYRNVNIYHNTYINRNVNIYRNVNYGNRINAGNYHHEMSRGEPANIYHRQENKNWVVNQPGLARHNVAQGKANLVLSIERIGDSNRLPLSIDLLPGCRGALHHGPAFTGNDQVALCV